MRIFEVAPQYSVQPNDSLIIVDVQNDFLPGGALGVPGGDQIIEPINKLIKFFEMAARPIFATRDWHPKNHSSFKEYGGIWPAHCVQNTPGAQFAPGLDLPPSTHVISKATTPEKDAYSGFLGTNLNQLLQKYKTTRVVVCGLATDYCVLNTALDAQKLGYKVIVPKSCIRAVNIKPDDEANAIGQMTKVGAEMGESKVKNSCRGCFVPMSPSRKAKFCTTCIKTRVALKQKGFRTGPKPEGSNSQ